MKTYELQCYGCLKVGTNATFGLGRNRQCPSCGSYEVHGTGREISTNAGDGRQEHINMTTTWDDVELRLERRDQTDETGYVGTTRGGVLIAPLVDEDYWQYRVVLSEHQAIVGFPKFGMIGIGFAVEENWNTNLPSTTDTDAIFAHIIENKGDEHIPDEHVRRAIQLVQEAAAADRG